MNSTLQPQRPSFQIPQDGDDDEAQAVEGKQEGQGDQLRIQVQKPQNHCQSAHGKLCGAVFCEGMSGHIQLAVGSEILVVHEFPPVV